MKKIISAALAVMCLCLLAACGNKGSDWIASGDEDSRYPYGWYENRDGSVTVEIRGEWEEDCAWVPVYDEYSFSVTQEEKSPNCFLVTSQKTGGSDVNFYLRRAGEEENLYCLWLYFNATPSGDISVLECTHEEIAAEGSSAYTEKEDGSLELTVTASSSSWQSRLIARRMTADLVSAGEGTVTFAVRADGADSAVWELWDEALSRRMTLRLTSDADGAITVEGTEESGDISLSEAARQAMEEALGVPAAVPQGVQVSDAALLTENEDGELFYGLLDLTVDGKAYEYALSADPALKTRFALGSIEDDEAEAPTAAGTESRQTLSSGQEVLIYERSDRLSAVWEKDGCYYAMSSEEAELTALMEAVREMAGESNG